MNRGCRLRGRAKYLASVQHASSDLCRHSNAWVLGPTSSLVQDLKIFIYLLIKIFFFNLLVRDTERGAETHAGEEADSLWGAQCRTWFQDPGITLWTFKADAHLLSHPGAPEDLYLNSGPEDLYLKFHWMGSETSKIWFAKEEMNAPKA